MTNFLDQYIWKIVILKKIVYLTFRFNHES